MSRKVLLIENRPGRQLQYFPNGQKDIDELDKIQNLVHRNYSQYLNEINRSNFDSLNKFDLLIIHRSVLGELSNGSKTSAITKYCKDKKKGLIYFSGGITSSLYNDEGEGFLLINSKEFYSENLIPFLKDYIAEKTEKLIELKYGDSWRLTYLLQLREYIALNICEPTKEYEEKIDELKDIVKISQGEQLDQTIKQEILKL